MRRPSALLPLLVLLVVLPDPAHGATVSLGEPNNVYFDGPSLNFVAAGGERNDVTIVVNADHGVTVRDASAPLVAGSGCRALDSHRARCLSTDRDNAIESGNASLKDGDDRVVATVPAAAGWGALGLEGGAGSDVLDASATRNIEDPKAQVGTVGLVGGSGRDRLIGGPGDDSLFGGGDDDSLAGGGGADTITGDDATRRPFGNDRIDGGGGADTLSYEDRRAPVRVDLARPRRAGARGERDSLRSIENVTGGDAHDVLLGNGANNLLQGSGILYAHRGNGDTLAGRGGNDELLDFGGGSSRLNGGAGADELSGADRRDRLRCGSGRDRVSESGGALVPRSCERFITDDRAYGPFVARRGAAVVRVQTIDRGGECRATLSLRSKARALLGRIHLGRTRVRRARRVVIPLTPAGRIAAARHRVILVDAFERCGDTHDAWRVRL